VFDYRFFRTPGVSVDVLKRFDMNEQQADRVRNGLVTGRSGKGYSECLISLQDHQGWIPMRVESSPFEDLLLNYDPNGGLEFAQYVADEHGGEEFEQLAADLEDDQENEDTADTIAEPALADD
jgi:hypothetical protein